MSIFALLTPDGSAIERYPLRGRDLRKLDPLRAWPNEPTDENFTDTRFVRVRETERPALGYGDTLVEGPPEKLADGHWHQTWVITLPDLQELKEQASSRVDFLESEKVTTRALARALIRVPPEARTRIQAVIAKADEVRAQIAAATTPAEIKAILDDLDSF